MPLIEKIPLSKYFDLKMGDDVKKSVGRREQAILDLSRMMVPIRLRYILRVLEYNGLTLRVERDDPSSYYLVIRNILDDFAYGYVDLGNPSTWSMQGKEQWLAELVKMFEELYKQRHEYRFKELGR